MSKTGSVARWEEDRGFGFISQAGGQSDVFVHRSSLIGCNTLSVGSQVRYESIFDDRKQKFQTLSCSLMPGEGQQSNGFMAQPQPFGMAPGPQMGSPNTNSSDGGFSVQRQQQFIHMPFQSAPNPNGQFQLFPPSPTLVDLPSPTMIMHMPMMMAPSPIAQHSQQHQLYPQGPIDLKF